MREGLRRQKEVPEWITTSENRHLVASPHVIPVDLGAGARRSLDRVWDEAQVFTEIIRRETLYPWQLIAGRAPVKIQPVVEGGEQVMASVEEDEAQRW